MKALVNVWGGEEVSERSLRCCRQSDLQPDKTLCVSTRAGVSLLSERSEVSFPNRDLKEPPEQERS